MPVIDTQDYRPSFPFTNGHFNTIYPAFFRKLQTPKFVRQRINTVDGDFLDIDCLTNNENKKVAFLFHGLEGSTNSQYIKAMANKLFDHHYDVIATNFRGCSGTPNNKVNTYHSGFTDDLQYVIEKYAEKYESSIIIGYSLGANVTLKYLGENPGKVHRSISKAFAVSVPIHLSDGSKELQKRVNYFYTQNFLKTLRQKIKEKNEQFPNHIDVSLLKKVNTIWDFDEYYTGPMNGFEGAEDYYSKSMSLQFLPSIKVESHIISSLDDPFLSKSCFPFAQAKKLDKVFLHATEYGGHVGFYQKGENYWIENKIAHILRLED